MNLRGPNYLNYHEFFTYNHLNYITDKFYPYVINLNNYMLNIGVENITGEMLLNWLENNKSNLFIVMFIFNSNGSVEHLFCSLISEDSNGNTHAHFIYDSSDVHTLQIGNVNVHQNNLTIKDTNGNVFLYVPDRKQSGTVNLCGNNINNQVTEFVYFQAIKCKMTNQIYVDMHNKLNLYITNSLQIGYNIHTIFELRNNKLPFYEQLYNFCSDKNPIIFFFKGPEYEAAIYFEITPFGYRKDSFFNEINKNRKAINFVYYYNNNYLNRSSISETYPISNFKNILEGDDSNVIFDFIYAFIDNFLNFTPNATANKMNIGQYEMEIYTCESLPKVTDFNVGDSTIFNNYFIVNCLIRPGALETNSHFFYRRVIDKSGIEFLIEEIKKYQTDYWFNLVFVFVHTETVYIVLTVRQLYGRKDELSVSRISIVHRNENSYRMDWVDYTFHDDLCYMEFSQEGYTELGIKYKHAKSETLKKCFFIRMYQQSHQETCYNRDGGTFQTQMYNWLYVNSIDMKSTNMVNEIIKAFSIAGFPYTFPENHNNHKNIKVPIYSHAEMLLYKKNYVITPTKYLKVYSKDVMKSIYSTFHPGSLENTNFIEVQEQEEKNINEEQYRIELSKDMKEMEKRIDMKAHDVNKEIEEANKKYKEQQKIVLLEQQKLDEREQELLETAMLQKQFEKELEISSKDLEKEREYLKKEKEANDKEIETIRNNLKEMKETMTQKDKEVKNKVEELENIKKETEKKVEQIKQKYTQELEDVKKKYNLKSAEDYALSQAYKEVSEKYQRELEEARENEIKQNQEVIRIRNELDDQKLNYIRLQNDLTTKNNKIEQLKNQIEYMTAENIEELKHIKAEHYKEKKDLTDSINNLRKIIQTKTLENTKNIEEHKKREEYLKDKMSGVLKDNSNLKEQMFKVMLEENNLRKKNDIQSIQLLKETEKLRMNLEKLHDYEQKLNLEKELNEKNQTEIVKLDNMLRTMEEKLKNLGDEKIILEDKEIALRKELNDQKDRFTNILKMMQDEQSKQLMELERQVGINLIRNENAKHKNNEFGLENPKEANQGDLEIDVAVSNTIDDNNGSRMLDSKRTTGAKLLEKLKRREEKEEKEEKERFKVIISNKKLGEGEIEEEKKILEVKENDDYYKILDGVIDKTEEIQSTSYKDKQIVLESSTKMDLINGSELFREWEKVMDTIDNRRKLDTVKKRVEASIENTPFSIVSLKDNMFSLPGVLFNIYNIIKNRSEFYSLCVFPIILYEKIEFVENIYNPLPIDVSKLEEEVNGIDRYMKTKSVEDECLLIRDNQRWKSSIPWKKMDKDYDFLGIKFEVEIPHFISILFEQAIQLKDHSFLLSLLICCYHTYNITSIKTLINNENPNVYLGYNKKSKKFLITKRRNETFTAISSAYPPPKISARVFHKNKESLLYELHEEIQNEENDVNIYYINYGTKINNKFAEKYDIVLVSENLEKYLKAINTRQNVEGDLKDYCISAKKAKPIPLLKNIEFICLDKEDHVYKKIFDRILDHSSIAEKIIRPYRYLNRDSKSVLDICSQAFFSIQYSLWIYFSNLHPFICEGYNVIIGTEFVIQLAKLKQDVKIQDALGDMRFLRSNIYTIRLDGELYDLLMTANVRYLYSGASLEEKKILLAESQFLMTELLKIVKKGNLQLTKYHDIDLICGDQTLYMIDFYIKKNYVEMLKKDDFQRKFYDLLYVGFWLADRYKNKELFEPVEKTALYLFYETYKIDSLKYIIEYNFGVTVDRYKEKILKHLEYVKHAHAVDEIKPLVNDFIFNSHTLIKKGENMIIFTPVILAEMYFKTSNQALSFMIFYINFINTEFSRFVLKQDESYGPLNKSWVDFERKLKGDTDVYYSYFRGNSTLLSGRLDDVNRKGMTEKKKVNLKEHLNTERTFVYKPFNKFNFRNNIDIFTESISTRLICENYELFDGLQINSGIVEKTIETAAKEIEDYKKNHKDSNAFDDLSLSKLIKTHSFLDQKSKDLTTVKNFVLNNKGENSLRKNDLQKYDIINPFSIKTASDSFTEVRFDLLMDNYDARFSSVLFNTISYYTDLQEEITEKYTTKNNSVLKTFYTVLNKLSSLNVTNLNIREYEAVNFGNVDLSGFEKFLSVKDTFDDCLSSYYCYIFVYGKNNYLITRDELKRFVTNSEIFYAHRYSIRYEYFELIDKNIANTFKNKCLKFDCGKNGTIYGPLYYYHLLLKALYMNDYEFVYFLVREGNLNYNRQLNGIKLSKVAEGIDEITISRYFLVSNKYFNEEKRTFHDFDYRTLSSSNQDLFSFPKLEEFLKKHSKSTSENKYIIDGQYIINKNNYIDKEKNRKILTIEIPDEYKINNFIIYSDEMKGYTLLNANTVLDQSKPETKNKYYSTKTLSSLCNLLVSLINPAEIGSYLDICEYSFSFKLPLMTMFFLILSKCYDEIPLDLISFLNFSWAINTNYKELEKKFNYFIIRRTSELNHLKIQDLERELILNSHEKILDDFINLYPLEYELEHNLIYFADLEEKPSKNALLNRSYNLLKKYIVQFDSHEYSLIPRSFEKMFDHLVNVYETTPYRELKIFIIHGETRSKNYLLTPIDLHRVIKEKRMNRILCKKRYITYSSVYMNPPGTDAKTFIYEKLDSENPESFVIKEFKHDIAAPERLFKFFLLMEKNNCFQNDYELYCQVRYMISKYIFTEDCTIDPFVELYQSDKKKFDEDMYSLPYSGVIKEKEITETTKAIEEGADDEFKSLF